MQIQNSGVNFSSMGFLKEAGEFFTGISDKIKMVWEDCLPAIKQLFSATANFFKTYKTEAIYVGIGLAATAVLNGLGIGAKKIYDYCTKQAG